MEHIQTILERVCKEDMESRNTPVVTKGTTSYFQGKPIGENLTYEDVMAFRCGMIAFYRDALKEILNYKWWLEGANRKVNADYYIAECRKGIEAYKLLKTA